MKKCRIECVFGNFAKGFIASNALLQPDFGGPICKFVYGNDEIKHAEWTTTNTLRIMQKGRNKIARSNMGTPSNNGVFEQFQLFARCLTSKSRYTTGQVIRK
jgi:hypothetical protein